MKFVRSSTHLLVTKNVAPKPSSFSSTRSGADRHPCSSPWLKDLAERRRREQLTAGGGFDALPVRGIARVKLRVGQDLWKIDRVYHQPMARGIG